MATYYATPGEKTSFPGGSNEMICIVADDSHRPISAPSFVNISAQGFTLDNATIGVRGFCSQAYDDVVVTEPKSSVTVGEDGAKISAIKISGVAAGAHFITFVAGK